MTVAHDIAEDRIDRLRALVERLCDELEGEHYTVGQEFWCGDHEPSKCETCTLVAYARSSVR